MIIRPRHHTARADRHILHLAKDFQGGLNPILGGYPVDHIAVHRCPPAPVRGLLHHHHPRAGRPGDQRRLQSRHPAACDQNVAERISMFIPVGIGRLWRFAQTRRLADDRFKDVLPRRPRMDEGLVIEPGRQEPRQGIVDHTNIEFQTGPVVLAGGHQPVKHLGRGDPRVGFQPRALPQIDQTVRLFGPAGDQPARTVIFETAPHQHLIVGQQRRRQRIPLKPAQPFAVKGELDGAAAVDQPPAFLQTRAHHRPFQSGRLAFIFAMISAGGSLTCAE